VTTKQNPGGKSSGRKPDAIETTTRPQASVFQNRRELDGVEPPEWAPYIGNCQLCRAQNRVIVQKMARLARIELALSRGGDAGTSIAGSDANE